MKIKVCVFDDIGAEKKISWRGLPVAGTDGLVAITRPVRATYCRGKKRYYASDSWWNVTHVPTGRAHSLLEDKKLSVVRARAKRFFKILKKHGVQKSTNLNEIKVVSADFMRAFG